MFIRYWTCPCGKLTFLLFTHRQTRLPRNAMVKDYRHLWKSVSAKGTKRSMAVQTLVQILLDEEGRKFVANLEHKSDLELCFKILDHVGHDLNPLLSFVDVT